LIEKASGDAFRCSRDGDALGRWQELPAWMFDRASCARIQIGADPQVDLAALGALIALLRETTRTDPASSNALLSGAASDSHDQNRGDAHATVDERPSRSSTRPAAVRPVCADKRRQRDEGADGNRAPLREETCHED
jgi:hypothetical protein